MRLPGTFLIRALPLPYFLCVSLPHHPVSDLLDTYVIIPFGLSSVQAGVNVITAGTALVFVAALFALKRKKLPLNGRAAAALLAAIGVMLLADRILIVNNIERIHYPQYAVLAILLRLSLSSDLLVLAASSFAGVVDEFLQYVVNPVRTNYLDFNDFVLNILGAALGLVIYSAAIKEGKLPISSYEKNFRIVFKMALGLVFGIVALAVVSGHVISYAEKRDPPEVFIDRGGKSLFVLSFEEHSEFWTTAVHGKRFHVLSPLEGIVTMTVLLSGYSYVFTWLKRAKQKTG